MRKKDIFEGNKELQSSLFLAQSYQDAWADYSRSLKKERFARWDYVVLTASNEEQAEGFKEQITLIQLCITLCWRLFLEPQHMLKEKFRFVRMIEQNGVPDFGICFFLEILHLLLVLLFMA